jgi:hypothetical protein
MIIQFRPPITEISAVQAVEAEIFNGLDLSVPILGCLPLRAIPRAVLFLLHIVAHLVSAIKEASQLMIAIWALLWSSRVLFVVFLNLISFFKIIKVLRLLFLRSVNVVKVPIFKLILWRSIWS